MSGQAGQVPQLDQLLRDGRDSHHRIQELCKGIGKFRKIILTEWLN
jgi:hypothetical protein